MSVLSCSRFGCRGIMCDRRILDGTMYICDSCMTELEAYRATWPPEVTRFDVRELIIEFMTTPAGSMTRLSPDEVEDEFRRLTTSPDEGTTVQ